MEGRTCEDCGMYIPESQFHTACCVIKGALLKDIVEAWNASKEADAHYPEGTAQKAIAVGAAIKLGQAVKKAAESLKKG